jgi:hypothetical protein
MTLRRAVTGISRDICTVLIRRLTIDSFWNDQLLLGFKCSVLRSSSVFQYVRAYNRANFCK